MIKSVKINKEIETILLWSNDIQKRLGEDYFHAEAVKKYAIEECLLSMVVFDVKSRIPSKEVKRVIREEADKYKDGRLYFMVFNDLRRQMVLLFYSFYLDMEEDCNFDDVCQISEVL